MIDISRKRVIKTRLKRRLEDNDAILFLINNRKKINDMRSEEWKNSKEGKEYKKITETWELLRDLGKVIASNLNYLIKYKNNKKIME